MQKNKQKDTKNIVYEVPQNEAIIDTKKHKQLTADKPLKNDNVNNEDMIKNQSVQGETKINQNNSSINAKSKNTSKNKKSNERKKPYIFAIIILSVLLAGSLVYSFTGGFYFDNSLTYEISLGKRHRIVMNNSNVPFAYSILVEGKVIVGDEIYQSITIKLPEQDVQNKKLRAQLSIGESQIPISILGFDNWLKTDENYYEYTGDISSLATIGLCNKFVIDGQTQLESGKVYGLNIVVWLSD